MNKFKSLLIACLLFLGVTAAEAQRETPKLYDPSLDARVEIEKMVSQAKAEGKHVLLQVGGNW